MDYVFIIIGFIVLIVGAHFLVEGAGGLAKRFNVPDLIIGLTVVAFGTSAPELVVNIVAASGTGTTDIALTNIIGSNTINTFVILGLAALIFPITSHPDSRKFDIPMNIIAPVIVFVLGWLINDTLSRIDGLILLLFFGYFMYNTVQRSLKNKEVPEDAENIKPLKPWLAIIMALGGLGALIFGADLIVPSAVRIAQTLGISQSIIGLTIVALGTSLPELATSAVAAFKKKSDIALGNVLGSNIFNIFLVLGVSSVVRPLPGYNGIMLDLSLLIISGLLIFVFVASNKKHQIKRWHGALLLGIYSIYIYFKISTPEVII